MNTRGFTLIELLIVVAIIGILAAVAIPSLLRARVSANEAAMIGDARAVSSAEATYASGNSNFYGVMSCLTAPATAGCLAGYNGPTFLDPVIGNLVNKNGYARAAEYAGTGINAGDRSAFCYQGRPMTAGMTGVRSFAVDATGSLVLGVTGSVDCCIGGGGIARAGVCSAIR